MSNDFHKEGLYRWKRQEPRTYSRSQKVTSNDEIQNWIKKVEEASNNAAEQVFGTNHSSGRARGRAAAQMTRDHVAENEQAYSEAQELLSEWMEEKVNLTSDPVIDSQYDDDSWQRYAIESDVKREWDNLLANNLEDYELPLSSRPAKQNSDLYNLDEDDSVAMVMQNMMDKQVVKKTFTKDLGLDPLSKHKDPRNKMELRHQQVKENREKRQQELDKRRREQRNKKEAMHKAKQMVLLEEREKEMKTKKEEMEIKKEMNKLRKEMQDERKRVEEMRAREKKAKEEALMAAKVKVAWEQEVEDQTTLEEERRREEKQRMMIQKLQELEMRQAANNLKILHKHFSAWYNVVLERRLKMGKARAMADWKLLLRAWNAWRSYVRGQKLDRESKQLEQDVIETHRKKQIADNHSRTALLRKYFIAWHIWVRSEQERRELEQAQNSTRNKMMSLLEAAASGKLWQGKEEDPETSRSTSRSSARVQEHRSTSAGRAKDKKSTAEKINALFENTRKIPTNNSICSTEGSEVSSVSDNHHKIQQSRLPTEPWQVTKKHLNLTPEEIASLGAGDPGCTPEDMNSKVLKRFGKQPWHKPEVSSYEHRHATQKKILEEQKKQIREQQRLIEELQFKSTHQQLQQQLAEQKLTLQQISQQVNNEQAQSELQPASQQQDKKSSVSIKATKKRPARKASSKQTTHLGPAPVSQKPAVETLDTSRTGATTNRTSRPESARTDVSKPGSYASTASEKSKYLQVLKNMEERLAERARIKAEREELQANLDMEERSAERARIKAEREEKRRKAEEVRLAVLEAEEAARFKELEDEKKRKAEAYREKKRLEKQREVEKQLQEEKLKQQNAKADIHYQKSILKYRGLVPMKKLVAMARENQRTADEHNQTCLKRKVLLSWHRYVREQWREKEELADEMSNFLLIKHCFQSWRYYKHHLVIQEHKASRHYSMMIKSKVFQAWRDYANEERVASWEKERKAREHYRILLIKRHFKAWKRLPDEIIREQEKEKRRQELRQKVAALLPDFEVSNSVERSTDFL